MSKVYYVRVKCEVVKQITCEDCTREQAEEDPYEFATDEMEIDQVNWEVLDVVERDE